MDVSDYQVQPTDTALPADEIVASIDDEMIALYRRKFIRFERSGSGFPELKSMQQRWQEQHGESTLHRRAFGEPDCTDEEVAA